VIVCPLRLEARALRHAGLRDVRMEVCGPGGANVMRWNERADRSIPRGTLVILAGLAAGLVPEARPGTAWRVQHVIDAEQNRSTSAVQPAAGNMVRVAGVERMLATAEMKRDVHRRTGAMLADMESHAMARCASDRGWQLEIVRGVSDGLDDSMPPAMESWVNDREGTRLWKVAAYLLTHPGEVGRLRRLGKASALAMKNVAAEVKAILNERESDSVQRE
jgi:hypothetical protein